MSNQDIIARALWVQLPRLPTDRAELAQLDSQKAGPFRIDAPLYAWATSEWLLGFSKWDWIRWRLRVRGFRWHKTQQLLDLQRREAHGLLHVMGRPG